MQRRLRIVLPYSDQVAILLLHGDAGRNARLQLTLGAFHGDGIAFDFDLHPGGDGYRFFTNPRH